MPFGDRTGPLGYGPRTGRAMGYCSGYPTPGFMNPGPGWGLGRGWFGRGRGFGFGRGWFGRGFGWGRGWGFGRGRGWRHFFGYPFPPGIPPAFWGYPYENPYYPYPETGTQPATEPKPKKQS